MLQPKKTKKQGEVSNTAQEGLDLLQILAKAGGKSALRKVPFGIGSAIGLTQSLATGQNPNVSDMFGLIPNGYGQAAALTMMYAEKEKENLQQFAANKMRGKDLTKLKPKEKELNLAVKSTIPETEQQELAFGTNQDGIMKTRMNPRKKYANGTNPAGVGPNNYIQSPNEVLNDYNIMLAKVDQEVANNKLVPIVSMIGGIAQQVIGMGASPSGAAGALKGNAGALVAKAAASKGGNIIATGAEGVVAANGMNDVNQDVEVEGGEMYETPQGETGEFKGPSHEEGGMPMEVGQDIPEGTKVYSDRLKVGNKTLAERKEARERQIANLEKIAAKPLNDQAVKNAAQRKMQAIQKEEMADLDFQEKVNNMQQMADNVIAAFGTSINGLQENPVGESMRYAHGTGADGVTEYGKGTNRYGILPGFAEGFGIDSEGYDSDPYSQTPKINTGKTGAPGFAEDFGVDANYQPEVYGTGDVNNYETNVIKNLHDKLGITPDMPGYGTAWGDKSNKALFDYDVAHGDKAAIALKKKGQTKWGNTKKDMLAGDYPGMMKGFELTPEGYKFTGTLDPEADVNTGKSPIVSTGKTGAPGFVDGLGMDSENGFGVDNEGNVIDGTSTANTTAPVLGTATGKVDLPGNMVSRGLNKIGGAVDKMGGLPGFGDMVGLFGDYLGATSGLKNAAEQRSSDITHTNTMINAGKESQKQLDNAMSSIEASKNQAIVKATTTTQGGKKSGRNSARGINQKRGMDWLYDTALNEQIATISANAASQVSDIYKSKSSVALSADQLKGEGQYKAEMANEAAKDAYYTAKGLALKDQALGVQHIGKDLNSMKQNKMIENLMKNYGTYVTADMKTGKLSNKLVPESNTTTSSNTTAKTNPAMSLDDALKSMNLVKDSSGYITLPNGKKVLEKDLLTLYSNK